MGSKAPPKAICRAEFGNTSFRSFAFAAGIQMMIETITAAAMRHRSCAHSPAAAAEQIADQISMAFSYFS